MNNIKDTVKKLKESKLNESTEDVVETLNRVFSSSFGLYFKAHSYHWNVTGMDFSQLHSFFGDIYEEIYEAIDVIAETIRTLNAFAPSRLQTVVNMSNNDQTTAMEMSPQAMISDLYVSNEALLSLLNMAYDQAERERQFGVSNMLQDRIQAHEKHRWMLKSHIQ